MRASLSFALCAVVSMASAATAPPACTAAEGSSPAAVQRLADDIRAHDKLFAGLVELNGPPSACRGRVGREQDADGGRIVFSWPDGSRLELASLPPETSTALYSNPQGLLQQEALMAAFRDYASGMGLHIDWRAAKMAGNARGAARTVEYQDPDVNGIVRLMHDQRGRWSRYR